MKLLYIFLFAITCINADYSIVFVHIGKNIPAHAYAAFEQARLFNSSAQIYLIANEAAIVQSDMEVLKINNIAIVSCESLKQTRNHKRFVKHSTLNTTHLNGFWFKTTERFFYVDELIKKYHLSHVFHLENDVLLYVDLSTLLPQFEKYSGIAATFDNDDRCIPGFLYIPDRKSIKKLADYLATVADKGLNDMEALARFRKEYSTKYIDFLPIVPSIFASKNILSNALGHGVENQKWYCNNFDEFLCIFDAAALGQYLGGGDPVAGGVPIGFINESCVFRPDQFIFTWEYDADERKVPYIMYEDNKYAIANLHIHSKQPKNFLSMEKMKDRECIEQ